MKTSPRFSNSCGQRRSGVVLLLVLGMLALFSLLTATYVIFTSQAKLASVSIGQRTTRAVAPEDLLDRASVLALSGSQDNSSAWFGQSILEDRYGNDVITGNLRNAANFLDDGSGRTSGTPGALSYVTGVPANDRTNYRFLRVQTNLPLPVDDILTGRYFTMTEGPLKNMTFRIVRSYANRSSFTDNRRFLDRILILDAGPHLETLITHEGLTRDLATWMVPNTATPDVSAVGALLYGKGANGVWGGGGTVTSAAALATDDVGLDFVINGRVRNGYGYGWNDTTGSLSNYQTITAGSENIDVPLNLLPNYASYYIPTAANGDPLPFGDPDEPFDVPDYRDMYLAHFPESLALGPQSPSFVRPALVNYVTAYFNQSLDDMESSNPERLQLILSMLIRSTMRPLPISGAPEYGGGNRYAVFDGGAENHAAFSTTINYSAPTAAGVLALAEALVDGPWDVDNNGNGINDSVFIDAGLPRITLPDGTLVQPMPAYRIEDLSGRVNVNTAGSLATLVNSVLGYNTTNNTARSISSMYARPPLGTGAALETANPVTVIQPAGIGYGPAEIDPRVLYTGGVTAATPPALSLVRGRYGNGFPGLSVSSDEPIGVLRRAHYPASHTMVNSFGLPMDVWGRGSVAVDPTGAPLFSGLTNLLDLNGDSTSDANELINDPYETMMNGVLRGDTKYTLAELEAMLRNWDWDQNQLNRRLVGAYNQQKSSPAVDPQRYVTTISSSDDQIPTQASYKMRTEIEGTSPLAYREGSTPPPPANPFIGHPVQRLIEALGFGTPPYSNAEITRFEQIVPADIRLGMKMDLNRWFGNGIDDDGDGVVDDPVEVDNGEQVYAGSSWVTNGGDFSREADESIAPLNIGQNGGRQRLAKDLYNLMMILLYDKNTNQVYRFPDTPTAPGGIAQPQFDQDFAAWRVAQWAVNVVDFRDPDGIMTRFSYDTRPYDGWDITPGNPTTKVVYGMETPELLLTEGLAFHDRRAKDTPAGGASFQAGSDWGAMPDDDLDQHRIPQGSSYIEIYNPRTPAAPAAPTSFTAPNPQGIAPRSELYQTVGTETALNLAATGPDGNPVFRVAIGRVQTKGETPVETPLEYLDDADLLKTAAFQTPQGASGLHMDPFDTTRDISVDRVVWMGNSDPTAIGGTLPPDSPAERIYWNRIASGTYTGSNPFLMGGQYAVIGPRNVTYLGADAALDTSSVVNYQSKQRIEMDHESIRMFNIADTRLTPDFAGETNPSIRPIVGIIAQANPPSHWTAANPPEIGFNISEPVAIAPAGGNPGYYPQPDDQLDAAFPFDSYSTALDTPFDKVAGRPLEGGTPENPDGQKTGTRTNFRTAFLQRLADPTQAYDANTNPYITVDWMPMDLTVFNGEQPETIETDAMGEPRHVDADDPNPYSDAGIAIAGLPIQLGSRYKSGLPNDPSMAVAFDATPTNHLYSSNTVEPVDATRSGGTAIFPYDVHVDPSGDINSGGNFTTHATTVGYLNHSFGRRWSDDSRVRFLGVPDQAAFPWIPWLDRPFASPYEIMYVPSSAPGRLGVECYFPTKKPGGPVTDPYSNGNPETWAGSYGSFLNYFAHDDADGGALDAPNVHRILDWIKTPQPYDALEQLITPNWIAKSSTWNSAGAADPVAATTVNSVPKNYVTLYTNELYGPPFNWIGPDDLRGKINLNTIVSPQVYRSIFAPRARNSGEYSNGAFWDEFINSRRSFAPVAATAPGSRLTTTTLNLVPGQDPEFPTPYVGAFQPGETGHVVPDLNTIHGGVADRMRRDEQQLKLTRKQFTDPQEPLFYRDPADTLNGITAADTPGRHPYFQVNEIARLPNLVSNNSNTFAMWVTVAMFEVDTATGNVLGEYNADQGTNKRYRAFYIIDRSVPVACEPGKEHNVKDTILFSRILN
ncbi:hypothetical protein FF011L_21750 [Roseimaritima multifibrata]|uniref:Uncharacterized protein n=1 Tax=Roseimaritima multifibrata TaxID=1930274 RepID=A0A517MEV2_9BACT|nr:hypothetical protein [Roseimaritima multifibrata]QDS93405.1 hypothetical protein FF011L_21750 [Roseimaritima multifibrata]